MAIIFKSLVTPSASKPMGNGTLASAEMESNSARFRWVGDAPTLGPSNSVFLHILKGNFYTSQKRGTEIFQEDYLGRVRDKKIANAAHPQHRGLDKLV